MIGDCRGRTILLAALLLCGAGSASAQQLDRPAVDAGRLQGRLSPETIGRLRDIAAQARREGVPTELLRRKVTEGVSKGVEGDRLERAIAAYARRLAAARELAGPSATPQVLEAAAEAAERGVPPDRIQDFLRANPNPLRSVIGLRVLADLREAGVPPAEASRGVNAALDRGLRGERLLALSAAVRRRVGRGESPVDALRAEVSGERAPADARRTPADADRGPIDARRPRVDPRRSPMDAPRRPERQPRRD